jgi:hypothetical protein
MFSFYELPLHIFSFMHFDYAQALTCVFIRLLGGVELFYARLADVRYPCRHHFLVVVLPLEISLDDLLICGNS